MASAAVIAADLRLGMKAPRDAADTLSDYGRFERGRFITWPRRVNLITRGALKIQASEQGTTHRRGSCNPCLITGACTPTTAARRGLQRKSRLECPRGSLLSTCCE